MGSYKKNSIPFQENYNFVDRLYLTQVVIPNKKKNPTTKFDPKRVFIYTINIFF